MADNETPDKNLPPEDNETPEDKPPDDNETPDKNKPPEDNETPEAPEDNNEDTGEEVEVLEVLEEEVEVDKNKPPEDNETPEAPEENNEDTGEEVEVLEEEVEVEVLEEEVEVLDMPPHNQLKTPPPTLTTKQPRTPMAGTRKRGVLSKASDAAMKAGEAAMKRAAKQSKTAAFVTPLPAVAGKTNAAVEQRKPVAVAAAQKATGEEEPNPIAKFLVKGKLKDSDNTSDDDDDAWSSMPPELKTSLKAAMKAVMDKKKEKKAGGVHIIDEHEYTGQELKLLKCHNYLADAHELLATLPKLEQAVPINQNNNGRLLKLLRLLQGDDSTDIYMMVNWGVEELLEVADKFYLAFQHRGSLTESQFMLEVAMPVVAEILKPKIMNMAHGILAFIISRASVGAVDNILTIITKQNAYVEMLGSISRMKPQWTPLIMAGKFQDLSEKLDKLSRVCGDLIDLLKDISKLTVKLDSQNARVYRQIIDVVASPYLSTEADIPKARASFDELQRIVGNNSGYLSPSLLSMFDTRNTMVGEVLTLSGDVPYNQEAARFHQPPQVAARAQPSRGAKTRTEERQAAEAAARQAGSQRRAANRRKNRKKAEKFLKSLAETLSTSSEGEDESMDDL